MLFRSDLNRHKIIVNSKQESSQAGIYAIGDCCYYDGKIDLIATGLGEAPTAVNNAINSLAFGICFIILFIAYNILYHRVNKNFKAVNHD